MEKSAMPKVNLNAHYNGRGGLTVSINVYADTAGEGLDTFQQIVTGLPDIVDPVANVVHFPMSLGTHVVSEPVPEVAEDKGEPEKKTRAKKEKAPEPQPEPGEPETAEQAAAKSPPPEEEDRTALDEALRFITKQYEDKDKRPALKGLLPEFGVSKFGEIPASRGADLLTRAKEVVAS